MSATEPTEPAEPTGPAAPPSIYDFLVKNVQMGLANAKIFSDGLEAAGVDGVALASYKANEETLAPILTKIATENKVDASYVNMVNVAFKTANKGGNAGGESASTTAEKKQQVDAVIAAANAYRDAVVKNNEKDIASTRSALDAALLKVEPSAGWNVPTGTNLLPKMDTLIASLTSMSTIVSDGNYASDHQMVTEASSGALRKASIFLPGGSIGQRAPLPLFSFKSNIKVSELSQTDVLETTFSSDEVGASFQNGLVQSASANTISAETGVFFGVGAVAITTTTTFSSAAETLKKVNVLTETRVASGVKTHIVLKGGVDIQLTDIELDFIETIKTPKAAQQFLGSHGTHVITATQVKYDSLNASIIKFFYQICIVCQVLGGLYILKSKVTFANDVSHTSYTEALSNSFKTSESASGWGVSPTGTAGSASAGVAHDNSDTSASSGGKTSTNEVYTSTIDIAVNGPGCLDAAVFRASLNHGNKCWNFISNGLSLEGSERKSVISLIEPVWKLFDRVGRSAEAVLLRAAWLDIVIDSDAILDRGSFFSQLVDNTFAEELSVAAEKTAAEKAASEKAAAEKAPAEIDLYVLNVPAWAKTFAQRLVDYRTPTVIASSKTYTTVPNDGAKLNECCYLDRQPVGVSKPLTQFQLHTSSDDNSKINYEYEAVEVFTSKAKLEVENETEDRTPANDGAYLENRYLDRHTVKVPEGRVLTGFSVHRDGNNGKFYYIYKHAQLVQNGVAFTYDASAVKRSETNWEDGAGQSLAFLDRHNICAPKGSLLVGFHLEARENDIHYEFWHVPVSALKRKGPV